MGLAIAEPDGGLIPEPDPWTGPVFAAIDKHHAALFERLLDRVQIMRLGMRNARCRRSRSNSRASHWPTRIADRGAPTSVERSHGEVESPEKNYPENKCEARNGTGKCPINETINA
jgi:hypothetical protein